LPGGEGHSELNFYGPSDEGGSSGQLFDSPGWAPGTFQLFTSVTSQPQTEDPTQFAGIKLQDVTVRGEPGVVTTAAHPFPSGSTIEFTRSVIWVEAGIGYRLDFTDGASIQDAISFAGGLSTLTEAGWQHLLHPATIRPDLVPMPDVLTPVSPTTTTG
jgi:hypothetical protein